MEHGALSKAGLRSADVKSGWSAERQWKNGPERGALETPGRAPGILQSVSIVFARTLVLYLLGDNKRVRFHDNKSRTYCGGHQPYNRTIKKGLMT